MVLDNKTPDTLKSKKKSKFKKSDSFLNKWLPNPSKE
jgi:hypothetical protein